MANKLILVVDDESINRFVIKKILENDSCEVHEAANGLDAYSLLTQYRYDMILLDLNMPVMDGYGFLQKIEDEKDYLDTPIFVVSGTNKDIYEDKLRTKGIMAKQVIGFMNKPINISDLKNVVNAE